MNMQISSTLFKNLLSFVPPDTKINVTADELLSLKTLPEFIAVEYCPQRDTDTQTMPVGRVDEIYFYRR